MQRLQATKIDNNFSRRNNMLFRSRILKAVFMLSITSFFVQATAAASLSSEPISYTDTGTGTPLVLIHAFPSDKKLWDKQVAGLKKSFRVITLDLWGFGQSGKVSGQAVTMADYADEVKQLLDQLHIPQAIVGGESMGGYVALMFLDKYPASVTGLLLSDTQAIADSPEAKAKREATALDILAHGNSGFVAGFMPKALSSQASLQMKQELQAILAAQSPEAMASGLRGMAMREDTSAVLSHSTLPILIITGEEDTLISPQQSQGMNALAKNSKLVVIPAAGHLSSFEQPAAWNDAVIGAFIPTKK
jgi:pimeloyl-ACP methyl ester carboxylesterase